MNKLLIVVIRCDTTKETNPNGDMFIPRRLTVVDVRKAGIWEYIRRIFAGRERNVAASCVAPDVSLTVGVPITTDQYAELMGIVGGLNASVAHGTAAMYLIPTPTRNQTVGGTVDL